MRDSEGGPGGSARFSRRGERSSLLPRGLLAAVILIAGFMISLIQQDSLAVDETVARAQQETGLHPVAAPTEATPDSARQAVRPAAQTEGGARDGDRSGSVAPVAEPDSTKSFAVDDARAYVYTVRMGEYWSLIADRFVLNADLLRRANMELWLLRGEEIRPGDQLTIPGLSADDMIPPIRYLVEEGDSWYEIAETHSVAFLDLLLDNFELWAERGINIRAGDEIIIIFLPPELTSMAVSTGRESAALANDPSYAAGKDARDRAAATSSSAGTYVAQPGDTWESVAAMTGIDVLALKGANRKFKGRTLRSGDILRISWTLYVSVTFRKAERRGVRSASDLATLSEEELAALAARGLAVYKEQYCGICHQLDSAGTKGIFGPSHDGMGSLAAARLGDPAYNGRATDVYAYLYESIIEPDIFYVEGFALSPHRMPTYRHIPEEDLEALIVFLADQ